MEKLEVPIDREVFRLTIPVVSDDIDDQNHVNNVVYVRWVQEVAFAHWKSKASLEMRAKWNWVVLRHEIDYHSPALPGDEIIASTWIAQPEGPRQRRYVLIQRSSDRKALSSACTTWCLLDSQSGKPKKVSAEISKLFGLEH